MSKRGTKNIKQFFIGKEGKDTKYKKKREEGKMRKEAKKEKEKGQKTIAKKE